MPKSDVTDPSPPTGINCRVTGVLDGDTLEVAVTDPRPTTGIASDCEITRVIDGDTLEVEVKRTFRVRLLDCWAPETRTRDADEKQRGLASKAHLLEILPVGSEAVVLVPAAEGGHIEKAVTMGRFLGRVWPKDADPRDVSQRQRDAGHATMTKR